MRLLTRLRKWQLRLTFISAISDGGEETVGKVPINSTMARYRAFSSSEAIVISVSCVKQGHD
jgi:hypothetical protein